MIFITVGILFRILEKEELYTNRIRIFILIIERDLLERVL